MINDYDYPRSDFELIQALMYVIITCKHEKDLIKNSGGK